MVGTSDHDALYTPWAVLRNCMGNKRNPPEGSESPISFLSGLTHNSFLHALFPIYNFHMCINLPYVYFSYVDAGRCISMHETSF